MKKISENEKYQPIARRDHTMTYVDCINSIQMVGGWNAFEWSPGNINLDVWVLDSSNLAVFALKIQNGNGQKKI